MVDRTALRVNQVTIIGVVVLAFVLGSAIGGWLLLLLGLSLGAGVVRPSLSPIRQLYLRVLRPLGLARPDVIADDPAPHRFAQGVGAAFLLAASALLFAGLTVAGWVLAWIVVALAGVNLLAGFCAGCFVYVQLERVGLLGRRPRTAA